MADNKTETLRALCAEGVKLGLTISEFWRQVRRRPESDEDMVLAAEETLADLRAGGTNCPKCDGTDRFLHHGTDKGPCFMCKGKGFETRADMERNFGYRRHQPGKQEAYYSG